MTAPTPPGLRERKKQATREALSHAAWALMIEDGLDAVTAERVAERAGVAERTFRNYFSCREEAVVEASVRRVEAVADALRVRPLDEPVWDSLAGVLPEALAAVVSNRRDVAVLLRVARQHPAILAQQQAVFEAIHRQLEEVIGERVNGTPQLDLAARLLAAAARAAITASIEAWVADDSGRSLPEAVRNTLAQLRAGIPAGNTAMN